MPIRRPDRRSSLTLQAEGSSTCRAMLNCETATPPNTKVSAGEHPDVRHRTEQLLHGSYHDPEYRTGGLNLFRSISRPRALLQRDRASVIIESIGERPWH